MAAAQVGEGIEVLFVIQACLGQTHERWLEGRPIRNAAFQGNDVRLFENGNIALVYALFEESRAVEILAILRN